MELDKYIRPDGTTYWAVGPLDPADKLFVESLDVANVRPKRMLLPLLLIGAGIWLFTRK